MKKKINEKNKVENLVHKGIIRTEKIKNESKYYNKNVKEMFTFNPKNYFTLTEKPNNLKKEKEKENDDENINSNEDYLYSTLDKITKLPKEKYKFPITRNQEIGWFNDIYNYNKPSKKYGIKNNDLTKWNENFIITQKINPYSKKNK